MFSIDERNKITLTKGDTAAFSVVIVQVDEDGTISPWQPQEGDALTFSIDDTDFSIEAVNNTFTITGRDTSDLDAGVYMYRVVVNTQGQNFTIFENNFLDLLGDGSKEEANDIQG